MANREETPMMEAGSDDDVTVIEDDDGGDLIDREEFFLPISKDDLIRRDGATYTFSSAVPMDEIRKTFHDDAAALERAVKRTGISVLTENFEAVASSIWHFNTMSSDFFRAIMGGLIAAVSLGLDRFEQQKSSSSSSKLAFRSELKVAVYLLSQYIEQLEKLIGRAKSTTIRKRGGQKQQSDAWMNELRMRSLEVLHALTEPSRNWSEIWHRTEVDKEFVRLVLTMLSRFCEDISIASGKTDVRQETDMVIRALSNCVITFQATDEFLDIMIKLFHRHDASGGIAADVIDRIYRKTGDDIVEAAFSTLEENMDDIAQDNSAGKAYANLLNGLVETGRPYAFICLDYILELLKSDAHSVRQGCVALLTSALISYYANRVADQPPSTRDRKNVDVCWELILDHVTDSNAFVRAKSCQSLEKLVKNSCITKKKYRPIFEKVIQRTGYGDKSQVVRKAALHCLSSLLEIGPEIFQQSLEHMRDQFLAQCNALTTELSEEVANDLTKALIIEGAWIDAQRRVRETADEYAKTRTFPTAFVDDTENLSFNRLKENIKASLEKSDGCAAFSYLISAAEKFPNQKLVVDYQLHGFLGEFGSDVPPHRMLTLLECMREILNGKDRNEINALHVIGRTLESLSRLCSSKTRKDASEIRLLQDDMAVRALLINSIPRWERTLQMMVASDIAEIALFLINAEKMGFKEANYVLRRLPSFFCSETKEIKEAALAAYKKFFVGENSQELAALVENPDSLVKKLLWEMPCISAANFQTIRILVWKGSKWSAESDPNNGRFFGCLLVVNYVWKKIRDEFKTLDPRLIAKTASMLVRTAVSSDDNEDVWRACLALSVLPSSADRAICEGLDGLYKRCLQRDSFDPRLTCTFCDVLIKIGRSPLEKEDITDRNSKKLELSSMHPMLFRFLDRCLLSFSDDTAVARTQSYGKIVEALFAVSDDPLATMRKLMYFTVNRLRYCLNLLRPRSPSSSPKRPREPSSADGADESSAEAGDNLVDGDVGDNSNDMEMPEELPVKGDTLLEIQCVLYFGATVVFVFANWMEDSFSSTTSEESSKKKDVGVDENEPDGPTEDDRHKAVVLHLRRDLFKHSEKGELSGVYLISQMIIKLCHAEATASGSPGGIMVFMALIRIMLISEHFCSQRIGHLLRTLNSTESLELKKTLLIGFSDISVRFVNIIQPHVHHFTTQLHHPNPSVRYHALMAVVRLIVNDLVKMRVQQCDLAVLICDPDDRISAVSRGFFKEKVPKQAIINMIPDFVGRVDLFERLDQSHTEEVLNYLVELAGKTPGDLEALILIFLEPLESQRPVRTWQIAAYGLNLTGPQLPDKFPTMFRERLSSMKKALGDADTLGHVLEMVASLRRKLPEDKKRVADDLAKMVRGMNSDKSTQKASAQRGEVINRQAASAVSRKSAVQRDVESEPDESGSDDQQPSTSARKRKAARPGPSPRKPQSSDGSSDEEASPQQRRKKQHSSENRKGSKSGSGGKGSPRGRK